MAISWLGWFNSYIPYLSVRLRCGFYYLYRCDENVIIIFIISPMQAAAAVARSHPNIQFIINHGGFPAELDEQAIAAWKEGLNII